MARRKKRPRPKQQPTLAVEAQQPGYSGSRLVVVPVRPAGVRVNEDTALTLGAVFACVRVISEDLAKLPLGVFEKKSGGGRVERGEDPADWLLSMQANPETPAFQFREAILAHAQCWGNGYAEIERDAAGRAVWLWLITPDRVEVKRSAGGAVIYDVSNPREPNTVLDAGDVFHLRGLGFDGLVGYGVVRLGARSMGLGIALEECAASFSQNDSTPGGTSKYPGRLEEKARTNLRESWGRIHGEPYRRRSVAILEEGLEWQQVGLPPEDSQLIEQRQFTPAEICRWFRVSPAKIADHSRSTFSNVEQQSIDHVADTLMPWAVRFEMEANIKLFGRTNRGKRFVRHNFNALLRGDTAARGALYTQMLDRGVYSINDVLEREDMNPIGKDGDKRFVPLNMQLLDKAGEEPPPPKAPPFGAPPPGEKPPPDEPGEKGEPPDSEDEPPGKLAALRVAFLPVLEDACARVRRREQHPFKSEEERRAYAKAALAPAAASLALLAGCDEAAAEVGLAVFLERYQAAEGRP